MNKIFCSGQKLIDELGRERIFHGSNICFKAATKHNTKDVYEKDGKWDLHFDKQIKEYAKHGVNLVRLGFNWDDVEPNENEFNKEYLDFLIRLGKKLEENNIHFFLDCHQDVWGIIGDNGAPQWATYSTKKPYKHMFIWSEGYFYMSWLSQAFEHFWKNDYQLQDKYKTMWKYVINQFDDNSALMGYDFMNEPYPAPYGRKIFATIVDSAFNLVDNKHYDYLKYFNAKNEKLGFIRMIAHIAVCRVRTIGRFKKFLKQMKDKETWQKVVASANEYVKEFDETYYKKFIANMSSEFSDKPTLIEHSYFSNLGIPLYANKPNDNCIYAPHGYDLWVDTKMYKYANNNRVDCIFKQCRDNQQRLNAPVIVGEFGATAPGEDWYAHIEHLQQLFDSYKWSFTYWGMPFDRKSFRRLFAKPYPVAVNGEIISYENKGETFTLKFNQLEDNNIPTIVFNGENFEEFITNKGINTITFKTKYKE